MPATGEVFFRLPDDSEQLINAVCSIINGLYSGWQGKRPRRWFSSYLKAPQGKIEAEEVVVSDTGIRIGRFNYSNSPIIVGGFDQEKGEEKLPDYYAITVNRKFPAFVSFSQIGYDSGMKINEAIAIACGFLKLGYSGYFHFHSDCDDNHEFDNPETCEIYMSDWRYFSPTEPGKEIHIASPVVCMKYYEQYGGKLENLQPIIDICQNLNLEQFEPQIPDISPTT